MSYVDGFVVPVPRGNKDAYRAMALKGTEFFKECGATQVVECWADDIPEGKINDFKTSVMAEPDEAVVFSWIVWPDKPTRDAANRKMKDDPRMQMPADAPFSGKRMIYGGFNVLVDTSDLKQTATPETARGKSATPHEPAAGALH